MKEHKFENIKDLEDFLAETHCEGASYINDERLIDAVIGTTDDDRVAYSYEDIIECLMASGSSFEDAVDEFDYNILNALPSMGNKPPAIIFGINK